LQLGSISNYKPNGNKFSSELPQLYLVSLTVYVSLAVQLNRQVAARLMYTDKPLLKTFAAEPGAEEAGGWSFLVVL
jgi:hypothetical protein